MTNGEKIKALFPDMYQVEQSLEAWDTWWNAEYKEPTTKNNLGVDCISRKSVITIIQNHWWNCRDIDKLVNELPSITPQPRKGHWIGHREHCENLGVMPSGLGCYEWCSNCDCGIDVREWHRNNYNFCPNCGADMREVEE